MSPSEPTPDRSCFFFFGGGGVGGLCPCSVSAAGGAWLGQLVSGMWEIRGRALLPALTHVLRGLVA